jgi:hypothetical protein
VTRWVLIAIAAAAGCKRVKELEHTTEQKVAHELDHVKEELGPIAPRAPEPPPAPHGPGIAPGRYQVRELHVDVKPRHLIREEPDLVLGLYVDGAHVADCRAAHTAHGACAFDDAIELGAASALGVQLVDRDGSATLTDPSTWGVEMAMPMIPHGDVTGATIVIAPWRSWWARHAWWLVGGALGALAIAGGLFAFRKRLFPPPPVVPPPPTCAHCGKRLAATDARCAHCGATP